MAPSTPLNKINEDLDAYFNALLNGLLMYDEDGNRVPPCEDDIVDMIENTFNRGFHTWMSIFDQADITDAIVELMKGKIYQHRIAIGVSPDDDDDEPNDVIISIYIYIYIKQKIDSPY